MEQGEKMIEEEWECFTDRDCEHCTYSCDNYHLCTQEVTHVLAVIKDQEAKIEQIQQMYDAAIAGQETLQKCARKQIAEIFAKIEKIIDEWYNRNVFGSEFDDTEIEAIINFSDSVSNAIDDLKRTYIGEVENE